MGIILPQVFYVTLFNDGQPRGVRSSESNLGVEESQESGINVTHGCYMDG
jgi:hypothetical protein